MKKITLFLIISLIFIHLAAAQGFRLPDRSFEIGLLNTSVNLTSDFMPLTDIFQESIVLDLDDLNDGFRLGFGVNISPIYININAGRWGFGIHTGLEGVGSIDLAGKMLSLDLNNSGTATSEASLAVFTTAGLSIFFHIQDFKVKLNPSVFLTLAYVRPEIIYTLDRPNTSTNDYIDIKIRAEMDIFTAYPTSILDSLNVGDILSPDAGAGFDFSFGIEYPLSQATGLKDRARYLDFDVGLDLVNIPILPSTLTNYMNNWAEVHINLPLDSLDIDNLSTDDIIDITSGSDSIETRYKEIDRPFKAILWANWRPFGNQLLTLTPSLGFAISPHFYNNSFSLEGGLNICFDLINLFIINAGINYRDRMWVNSVNLAVNLWLLEVYAGVEVRSQNILKSFSTAGLGVNLGVKLGF